MRLRHEHTDVCVIDHERESRGGIGRIEGNVSRARLQDGEYRNHHFGRAFDADAHPCVRSDTLLVQLGGQPVGERVEGSIGQPPVSMHNRDRVRLEPCLFFEELVHAARRRVGRLGPIPDIDERHPLGIGQERQLGDAASRIGRDAFEHELPVLDHAAPGVRQEQIGAVGDAPDQTLAALFEQQVQVALDRADLDVELAEIPTVTERWQCGAEAEHRLEDGVRAGVAVGSVGVTGTRDEASTVWPSAARTVTFSPDPLRPLPVRLICRLPVTPATRR